MGRKRKKIKIPNVHPLMLQKKDYQKNLDQEMKKRNQKRVDGNHHHGQKMYWRMMAVFLIIDQLIVEQLVKQNMINLRNMQLFNKKLTMKLHELRQSVNVFNGNKMN